jgi:hypothetical protein
MILNMICVNNVWVWVQEYYSDSYKIEGGALVSTRNDTGTRSDRYRND